MARRRIIHPATFLPTLHAKNVHEEEEKVHYNPMGGGLKICADFNNVLVPFNTTETVAILPVTNGGTLPQRL